MMKKKKLSAFESNAAAVEWFQYLKRVNNFVYFVCFLNENELCINFGISCLGCIIDRSKLRNILIYLRKRVHGASRHLKQLSGDHNSISYQFYK